MVLTKVTNFNFKKNFLTSFYRWGPTAFSRLEPLQGGSSLFTTKFPEILSTLEG